MPAPFSRTTRSLAQDTPLRAVATWLVAAALLALWAAWALLGKVTLVELSPQARLEVQQAAHPVSAQVPGRVLATHVQLGQPVQAGEVLVELDPGAEALRLNEETARVQALGAQVQALRREISTRLQGAEPESAAAQAALQAAQARTRETGAALSHALEQERRLREEAQAGSVAAVEAQQARAEALKLAAAREALSAEARRLDAAGRTRAVEQRAQIDALQRTLAALQGEEAAAAQSIARLQLEIERHRVRAPVAGHVGEMAPLRAGDVVAAGQKFATVVPPGALMAVAEFEPRAVFGRVHAGQAAQLRLDGFPWAQYGTLKARVSRVAGEIRDGRVRVEFSPDGPWPEGMGLQHGLPGSVEVTVDRLSPAVLALRASGQWLAASPPAAVPVVAATAAPAAPGLR